MAERISQDNFDTKILQAEGVAVADFLFRQLCPCKTDFTIACRSGRSTRQCVVGKVKHCFMTEIWQKNTRWHLHRRLSFSKMEQK